MRLNKKQGATNTLLNHKRGPYEKLYHTTIIEKLQGLRDEALECAIKYRWDPAIGSMHTQYLNVLNEILTGVE